MLKPSLQLKLGQSLTMTPQLQQAIRLLQLPILDLNAEIQEALEENIMLEVEDLPDAPGQRRIRLPKSKPSRRTKTGRPAQRSAYRTAAGMVKADR